MTIYAFTFYLLSALLLITTALAVTRRNLVHAVVYLVASFFGSAMLFYLLGAPFLAALEVIIYAGAIMVLFLFVIMMLDIKIPLKKYFSWPQRMLVGFLCGAYLALGAVIMGTDSNVAIILLPALAKPADFGAYLFKHHFLAVEIVSLLLLVALIGAMQLGKRSQADPGAGGKL
jgi:NADH-quinone oxidoreductase subunit J